jgi:hypothetical protein
MCKGAFGRRSGPIPPDTTTQKLAHVTKKKDKIYFRFLNFHKSLIFILKP